MVELAVAAALRADGSNMRAVTVPQHLNARITVVSHNDVPSTVKGDASGTLKLAVARALAANGAEMRAVRVPQHLDAVVTLVADDKVALGIKREEAPVAGNKLAAAAACTAKAPQVRPIAESKHLHTTIAAIKHGDAARTVASDCVGADELAVATAFGADW